MPNFRGSSAAVHGLMILAISAVAVRAANAQHFPPDEDLKTMLRYLVEDGETPGIVLGILEADGTTRILWHGSAGKDAKRPLGPKSLFEIGSITKVFTGTLLADMVERGEVALSDPVSKYLPAGVRMPARNGKEITLLDLATHRSSLPRMPSNMPETRGNVYPDYSVQDMYAFLSRHELRRDIGSEFEYSNIAVALLGEVLARAAGEKYDVLLKKRVLDPLGMRMTSTVITDDLREWNTQGHDQRGGIAAYRGWAELPAMGALRSNAEDMLTFLKANVGTPKTRLERVMRMAHEPRAKVTDQTDIALNWHIRKVGNRRIINHGGATAGYETQLAFDPDKRMGFVLLTNTAEFDDDLPLDLLRREPPPPIREIAVAKDVLAGYVGEYELAAGRNMVVRLEPEGWLTMQAPGNVRFRMYASSDTSFFVKRTPWRFTFTRDANGTVASVTADLEGQVRQAKKVSNGGPPPKVVAGNAALDLPLTREEMERYVGTYTVKIGEREFDLRIFIENGQLIGHPSTGNPSRMLYGGNHEFRPESSINLRIAFTLENGRAEKVTVYQGNNVSHGTRKQ